MKVWRAESHPPFPFSALAPVAQLKRSTNTTTARCTRRIQPPFFKTNCALSLSWWDESRMEESTAARRPQKTSDSTACALPRGRAGSLATRDGALSRVDGCLDTLDGALSGVDGRLDTLDDA